MQRAATRSKPGPIRQEDRVASPPCRSQSPISSHIVMHSRSEQNAQAPVKKNKEAEKLIDPIPGLVASTDGKQIVLQETSKNEKPGDGFSEAPFSSYDQHRVPVGKKAVALLHGLFISPLDEVVACECGDEHQKRGAGRVEIGDEVRDRREAKTRRDIE